MIRGLHITVYDVLSYLASGMTPEEILADFPYLTKEDIMACLSFAAEQNKLMDKEYIKQFCDKNGISEMSVFGSVARGEADEKSDIDLLVEFSKPISLFGLVHLQNELEDHFDKKVDLVTKNGISKYIKDRVLKEAKVLYAQPR